MNQVSLYRTLHAVAALWVATAAWCQWNFSLDTTFRTVITRQSVNSVLPMADGTTIASGVMRFPGELSDKRLVRFLPDGTRDPSFNNSVLGGERITPWQDRLYVDAGLIRRILLPSGNIDPSFMVGYMPIPYFLYSNGGDYHVYPDGSVVMSGSHELRDSVRGFVGYYELIWFTNTGYLDTTKTHRNANGPIWEFKELPDGKFICGCSCTQYEGHPVDRVFRVHADGVLDTTFHTGINLGNVYAYQPLSDGRVLMGGNFRRAVDPNQVLQFVRLLPNGTLDLAFENFHQFDLGTLSGTPKVLRIEPWQEDKYFVLGHYRGVDGDERGGICVMDTTAELLPLMDDCLSGPFTYQGLTAASLIGILPTQDTSGFYIWGSYAGYDDGTINDTLQRFVSRLLVEELSTAVDDELRPQSVFEVHPNPTTSTVRLAWEDPELKGTGYLSVTSAQGKLVHTIPIALADESYTLDVSDYAPGLYDMHLVVDGQWVSGCKVVVE